MAEHPKNVIRIDTGTTHGWQVRFKRQGKQYSKFFADKKHGGREAAKQLAVDWRDAKKDELPAKGDANETRARRSETGVRGLSVNMQDIGNGTRKPYVQVSAVLDEGQRKSSSFSIEKWGWRRALWKGCRRLGTWKDWDMEEMQRQFTTALRKIDRSKYSSQKAA